MVSAVRMSEAKRARDLSMAQSMSLVQLIKRITKSLDGDNDDAYTFLDHLINTYPPGKAQTIAAIAKSESIIKKSSFLDLVLEKVPPETKATSFLGSLKLLSSLRTYRPLRRW